MTAKADTRQQALDKVGGALRALAANLISIVRGVGKPLELGRNVDAFTAALGAFEGATGAQPQAFELADMLRVDLDPKGPAPVTADDLAELYAQHAIIHASLQLAAARLTAQEAGAAKAYAELHAALSGLEEMKCKIAKRRDDADRHILEQMKAKTSDRST
jgi:hypothetical protein